MKTLSFATAAVALSLTSAQAGGVDRSGQPVGILFEDGNYAELSFSAVSPDVSGVQTNPLGPLPAGGASGNMTESYRQFALSYKHSFGDNFDAAIILNRPYGADVAYPAGQPYFASGSTAALNSSAVTGMLKYRFPNNFSVYGGLRYESLEAKALIPFVTAGPGPGIVSPGAPYQANGEKDNGWGYLAGVAYQRPEIALRVSLTYQSAVSHDLDTSESSVLGNSTSTTEVSTPKSVTLDFETGIAADTLLFGSVRWVNWTEFDISPADYQTLTGVPLVSYDDDTTTYALGIGRRLTDKFSGAISVGYEPENNGFSSNLGPTDGNISIGIGGTYLHENMSISAGVSHLWIGNARTLALGNPASRFEDNTAVAFGVEVGYHF